MLRKRQACERACLSIRHSLVHWFVGVTLAGISGLLLATNAVAQSTTVEFNIPAQSVSSALRAYARQANVQLLVSTQGLNTIQANSVVGSFDPPNALQMLLAGTGLQAQYRSDSTITVGRESDDLVGAVGSMDSEELPFLLAQANVEPDEQIVAQNSQTGQDAVSEDSDDDQKPGAAIEEIIVTGTNIRGVSSTAPIVVIDREAIDASGMATLEEVMQALPQNFAGGPNPDTSGFSITGRANLNPTFGSGINLRGLGADATLVLVNGRRTALSGIGSFSDVSSVPLSAVERVEIVSDGASAIYGSDAVGGVVNIILKDDFDGIDTRLRYGTVTDGNSDQSNVALTFGNKWNSGNVVVGYEYFKSDSLAVSDRLFASSDLRPFGGDDFRSNQANPGNIFFVALTAGGFVPAQIAIPEGQDGTSLTTADLLAGTGLVNLTDAAANSDILPEQERHSVFASLSHRVSDRMELFGEGRFTTRDYEARQASSVGVLFVPASNAFFVDPPVGAASTLFMNYSFADDLGPIISSGDARSYDLAVGLIADVSNSWQLEVYGSHGRDESFGRRDNIVNTFLLGAALGDMDPSTAFNPFADGSNTNPATIESIRGFSEIQNDFEITSIFAKADGKLISLSGGEVRAAVGAEYREESHSSDLLTFTTTAAPVAEVLTDFVDKRDITAVFAEVFVPFVGEQNAVSGIRRLEFTVAARYEDYSDFGSTTNPKVGALWSPVDGLVTRATWGESFKAPGFEQSRDSNIFFVFPITDPQSLDPSGTSPVLFQRGTNPNLRPETATTWTAGLDITPPNLSGLELNFTYFRTEFEDRIVDPSLKVFEVFTEIEIFGSLVERNPDINFVTDIYADPDFDNARGFTPADIATMGAFADMRVTNFALVDIDGIDFAINYGFESSAGEFDLGVSGTYLLTYDEGFSRTSPVDDILNTTGFPIDLRLRGKLSWTRGGLTTSAFVNHTDGYKNNRVSPQEPVGSYTTVDLNVGYTLGRNSDNGWLNDLNLSLIVQNLFDEDPPFLTNDTGLSVAGYDPENANAMGAFIAFQISKEW